jgi:hypothetical protein
MAVMVSSTGRPSNADLAQRDARARREAVRQLMAALRYLRRPSLLSATPICEREDVRRRAAALRGYRYPRAQTVIAAVRGAWGAGWEELGETDDACYLRAVEDALHGLSRRRSARRAGVCETEISKRRRKGVEMVADHFLMLLHEPSWGLREEPTRL